MKRFYQLQLQAFAQAAPEVMADLSPKARALSGKLAQVVIGAMLSVSSASAHAGPIPGYETNEPAVAVAPSETPDGPGPSLDTNGPRTVVKTVNTVGSVPRAILTIGSGAVGAWGSHQVAKKAGANEFWANTFGLIGGGVAGAIASAATAPKRVVQTVPGDPLISSKFDPNKYEFRNGKIEMSLDEARGLKSYIAKAEADREALAQNRQILEEAKYKLTFATADESGRVRSIISSAQYNDRRLVEAFEGSRYQLSARIWIAAMDLDRMVPADIMIKSGSLAVVPTAPNATSAMIRTADIAQQKPAKAALK